MTDDEKKAWKGYLAWLKEQSKDCTRDLDGEWIDTYNLILAADAALEQGEIYKRIIEVDDSNEIIRLRTELDSALEREKGLREAVEKIRHVKGPWAGLSIHTILCELEEKEANR